ncbi:UNVERIFIED_CONTAM: hypothetical protein FKN15_037172 [Acipenser sinensis]
MAQAAKHLRKNKDIEALAAQELKEKEDEKKTRRNRSRDRKRKELKEKEDEKKTRRNRSRDRKRKTWQEAGAMLERQLHRELYPGSKGVSRGRECGYGGSQSDLAYCGT